MSEISEFLKAHDNLLMHVTVRLVSISLACISEDVDPGAKDGETRPLKSYEIALSVLNDAASNESINDYISGLTVCVDSAIAANVKNMCYQALALCLEYKQMVLAGDYSHALNAALDARECAGQAINQVLLTVPLANRASKITIRAEKARRSEQSRAAAFARNAIDEKRRAMAAVRLRFFEWKQAPDSWKSKAAFARDMCTAYPVLESSKHIENKCADWEKEASQGA